MINRPATILLVITICLLILAPVRTYASAWLPPEKQYKFTSSIHTIDSYTKRIRKLKNDILLIIARYREEIYEQEHPATGFTEEQKELIEKLDFLFHDINRFNDDFLISNEIEYGINQKQSIGLDIKYYGETNLKYHSNRSVYEDHSFQKSTKKEASLYYKHSIFKNDRWQISLVPRITHYHNQRKKARDKPSFSLEGYVGYSRPSRSGKKRFTEFGFSVTEKVNKPYKNTIIRKFSLAQGFELVKGLSLNNYWEFSFIGRNGRWNDAWTYEQIALAKEFLINNNEQQNLNLQLGYYWKRGFRYKIFRVSGPVFSLWLNI